MKLLGLLRHAKSDWDDLSLRDFDRGLNDRGRKGAALMGAHIRDHNVRWDKMLASPAQRVKRTIEASGVDCPVIWKDEAYLADNLVLTQLLAENGGDAAAVLLVAHNPGLQTLLFDLVAAKNEHDLFREAAKKYPTGTFAVLELDIDDWADCRAGCGRLVHFARPRDLDPALGPECIG